MIVSRTIEVYEKHKPEKKQVRSNIKNWMYSEFVKLYIL